MRGLYFLDISLLVLYEPKKLRHIFRKTSPKGFLASKCDVGNRNFLRNWRIFLEEFFEKLEDFFGGFFWKECFGRNVLGEMF